MITSLAYQVYMQIVHNDFSCRSKFSLESSENFLCKLIPTSVRMETCIWGCRIKIVIRWEIKIKRIHSKKVLQQTPVIICSGKKRIIWKYKLPIYIIFCTFSTLLSSYSTSILLCKMEENTFLETLDMWPCGISYEHLI